MNNHKPISIVFDAYHLYHLPQFDPVIDLMQNDDRFDIYLTTSAKNNPAEQKLAKDILRKRGNKCIFADNEEERAARIRKLASDVFICGWSRYPIDQFVPDSTIVGMIYHGIGVKPSYWRDNHSRLDIRFIEGHLREKQLRQHGIETDLELTGFAKLDPLFNGQIPDQKTVLKELGCDPDKKTILYAPTFYPSSMELFGMKLGKETKDYNLLIKLHTWVYYLNKFGGINLKNQRILTEKLAAKFDHIKILEPDYYNIIPLYRAADVLLTEASSTIYEMMALDKPVIVCQFYKLRWSHLIFRHRLFKKRLDKTMSSEMTKFCIFLERSKDLKNVLEAAFNGHDPKPEQREQYKYEMLYSLDGQVSERIRDSILKKVTA